MTYHCIHLKKLSLADLLKKFVSNSDYTIVTCSLNNKTRGLLNKKMIQLANKGVIIINVARGPVIVEKCNKLLENKFIKSVILMFLKLNHWIKIIICLNLNKYYGSHNKFEYTEAVLKTSKISN